MEKKKNYVQPESTSVELEVNGIICISNGEGNGPGTGGGDNGGGGKDDPAYGDGGATPASDIWGNNL